MSRTRVWSTIPGTGLLVAALFIALISPALAGEELAIGENGPEFNLKGTDMKMHSLEDVAGEKGTAVIFTCNMCPFSKGYEERLIDLAKGYQVKGIGFVAINPNDPEIVPGDGFDQMVERAKERNFPYPYLVDTTQEIAAAYGARVTPHIFLLDGEGMLSYRGRIDDSLKESEVTARDFEAAMTALVNGEEVPLAETKAFGCSIKRSKTKS